MEKNKALESEEQNLGTGFAEVFIASAAFIYSCGFRQLSSSLSL